jgi:hypothetical protein
METHAGLLDVSAWSGEHPRKAHQARSGPTASHLELVGALEAHKLREDTLVTTRLVKEIIRTNVVAQFEMLCRPTLEA